MKETHDFLPSQGTVSLLDEHFTKCTTCVCLLRNLTSDTSQNSVSLQYNVYLNLIYNNNKYIQPDSSLTILQEILNGNTE